MKKFLFWRIGGWFGMDTANGNNKFWGAWLFTDKEIKLGFVVSFAFLKFGLAFTHKGVRLYPDAES